MYGAIFTLFMVCCGFAVAESSGGLPNLQRFLPDGFSFGGNGQPLEDGVTWLRTPIGNSTFYTILNPPEKANRIAVQLVRAGGNITHVIAIGNGYAMASELKEGRIHSVTSCNGPAGIGHYSNRVPLCPSARASCYCEVASQSRCDRLKDFFRVQSFAQVKTKATECGQVMRAAATSSSADNDFRASLARISQLNERYAYVEGDFSNFSDSINRGAPISHSAPSFFDSMWNLAHLCSAVFSDENGASRAAGVSPNASTVPAHDGK